jgi:hypothetical protein
MDHDAVNQEGRMAEIRDEHVEWRVVDRLRELLEKLPDSPHDVTLTYSLFSTILCWTCQRMRAKDRARLIWEALSEEKASAADWGLLGQIEPTAKGAGAEPLSDLPASRFLVALRNATAHGDDRKVEPVHIADGRGADRRLIGFTLSVDLFDDGQDHRREEPRWGRWVMPLTSMDMRRIGLNLAARFCDELGRDAQQDATRHVLVA